MADAGADIRLIEAVSSYWADLKKKLDAIHKGLIDFTRSTEVEFLDVGEGLQEFHRRSGELSKRASAIVDLMLGDEISGTMNELQGLLARITSYADALENESEDAGDSLRDVLQKLDKVEESVVGFRKIVKTMTILGLSTKIENARNVADGESFNILANDLVKLARNIDQQARQVQGQLQVLESLVREAVHNIQALKNQRKHQTQRVLSDALDKIALLAEKNQLSSQNAEQIALLISSIADKIGNVVASIQSHDLTRQQIEHVTAALDDLQERVGAKIRGGCGRPEIDRMVGEVCRLQVAQLEHSREQLLAAVTNIRESLREIAVNGLAMADQTLEIAGATNEAGFSFLAEMEQGTALIASALNENADANRESVSTLTDLARSVAQMEDFLLEIERIGGEMKVLALNAGIKAARISEGGAGLSVIAEAIQKLSGNALQATTSVTGLLRDITDSAQKLSSEEGTDLEAQSLKVDEFIGEIGSLLQSLQVLNENIVSNLTGIGEEGRGLAEDIDLVASGVSVQEKTIKVFGAVLKEIKRLGAPKIVSVSPGRQYEEAGMYCDLMDRYTMHSEREIHRTVVGGSGIEEKPSATDDRERDSEFGDNVELF